MAKKAFSTATLVLAFGLMAATPRSAAGVPVRILLQPDSAAQEVHGKGVLRLTPLVAGPQAKPFEVPAVVPGEQTVELKPGLVWLAELSVAGLWGEPREILPEKAGDGVSLRVFPTGTVQGRLAVPAGEQPPAAVSLRLQSTPFISQGKPVAATVLCPVRKGAVECTVPAGVFDLRLRADDTFAPIYLWGVTIEPGKASPLGDLRLERGASLSGWVETEDRTPVSPDCRLKLSVQSAPHNDPRLNSLGFETKPNARGFFQFTGIAPGQYVLEATQPGFAPAEIWHLEIKPGLESQITERLVLAKPVSFVVSVDPPVEPYGRPWQIRLLERGALNESPRKEHRGMASREGIWKTPGLAPGTYEIQVVGELDSVWHSEFLDVAAGEPGLRIEVPVVRIRGRVLLGKEPFPSTVWLGRKGRRLRFDADAEGRIEGILPGAGTWLVELRSAEEGWRMTADPVEVEVPKGKSFAEVTIAVPNTILAGEVVDSAGRPVPGVKVVMTSQAKELHSHATTDDKGQISVRGLPAGPLSLRALQGELSSDWVQTVLPEEGESPRVRIVLQGQTKVTGRIVSPSGGGVAGAMVIGWSVLEGMAASASQDISDQGGAFHLQFPGEKTLLSLIVLPPGHALRIASVVVSPGQPVQVPVEREGGTLILESDPEGARPLLIHNGVFVPLQFVLDWARMQGTRSRDPGRLVVPNAGAGAYSFCAGGGVVSRLLEGKEPPAARCASGVLAPNGELVLRAPAVEPSR